MEPTGHQSLTKVLCLPATRAGQPEEGTKMMGVEHWIGRLQGLLAASVRLGGEALAAADRAPGFAFDETMTGTISLHAPGLPEGERRMQVQLQVQAETLGAYLRGGRTELHGRAEIAGVTSDAPLHGSLWIWPHLRVIRYEFTCDLDGYSLSFAGQKDVRLLNFRHTMSTLPGELFDAEGELVGQGQLAFDWADLRPFLASMRLHSRAEHSA